MFRKTTLTTLLASSAVVLAVSSPAFADKKDRAQEAIAAAEAKLHTAESLGTGVEVPAATASARAALATAREDLKSGHKSQAIEDAIHAQALADTAIGELQRRKNAALADARAAERDRAEAARAQVDAAKDQVAAAQVQAGTAQVQAETAQQQAAEANARAERAEQAAAASAADAAAARAAAVQTPAPTEVQTTVTTQHRGAVAHRSTKTRVVKRTATTAAVPASSTEQVTTTVTQQR